MELTEAIANYIEQRKQAKLEPLQKVLNRVLNKTDNPSEIAAAKALYAEKAAPIEAAFVPEVWLTDAAKRAKQISLATHAAKFTHSDAKASSMLVSRVEREEGRYLTTAHLLERAIDAVGNAAALDVARLLKLEAGGESLIQQLQQRHVNALKPFTSHSELLSEWQQGFQQALGDEKLSAHTLTKQLYFPTVSHSAGQAEHHLVCPLFSSSLAHALKEKINATRFGDSKQIREAHKNGHYHTEPDIRFPATAIQSFGGSKPQNISQLNSERYGQSFLLNCAPPSYRSQFKPPVAEKSLFNRRFRQLTAQKIREFKSFLSQLKTHERNFKVRYQRDHDFVLPLIDELLNYAATVQQMTEEAGWSAAESCLLKREHALWLDRHNTDPAFQRERDSGDWISVIAHDFASWLNHQLNTPKAKRYVMGDVEHSYFKKICLLQLKAFERSTTKWEEA